MRNCIWPRLRSGRQEHKESPHEARAELVDRMGTFHHMSFDKTSGRAKFARLRKQSKFRQLCGKRRITIPAGWRIYRPRERTVADGDLHVRSKLYGCVVDDRVIPVRGSVVVGDWPGSDSRGLCANRQAGNRLRVLGESLAEDESTAISIQHIHVLMTHTKPRRHIRSFTPQMDHRFLATAMVMVLVGGWIDAAEKWVERTPPACNGRPCICPGWIDAARRPV